MDTAKSWASTFRKKTQRKNQGVYLVPTSSVSWKENRRWKTLSAMSRSWKKLVESGTRLGMAGVLQKRALMGTNTYILAKSHPKRLWNICM